MSIQDFELFRTLLKSIFMRQVQTEERLDSCKCSLVSTHNCQSQSMKYLQINIRK